MPKKNIQSEKDTKTSPDVDSILKVGTKVSAKCKGSSRFYPGKIRVDNNDGTYDIAFEDGDRDKQVPISNIKMALDKALI